MKLRRKDDGIPVLAVVPATNEWSRIAEQTPSQTANSGIAAAVKFAEGIVAMRLATSQIGPFASDLAA